MDSRCCQNSINFKIEPPNYELMPSVDLQKTLNLVKDIFDSYNNSVVSIETKKEDYIQVNIILYINVLVTVMKL